MTLAFTNSTVPNYLLQSLSCLSNLMLREDIQGLIALVKKPFIAEATETHKPLAHPRLTPIKAKGQSVSSKASRKWRDLGLLPLRYVVPLSKGMRVEVFL